jgi:FkbM family methyltransferase
MKSSILENDMEWVSEKVLKYLNYRDGVYLECGANNGVTQSNTYTLEKDLGWSGVLIEPSKTAFEECKRSRSDKNIFVNCALVSSDYEGNTIVGDFDGHLMSSVNGKRRNNSHYETVQARKLSEVLSEKSFSEIDFFSLDAEGYEYEILKGINFDIHSFKFILIEIYSWDFEKIKLLLERNGYELIENLSGFTLETNPYWDGTHNDFLFKKISF